MWIDMVALTTTTTTMTALMLVLVLSVSVVSANENTMIRDPPMVTLPPNFWIPQSLTETPEWATMKWSDVQGCCGIVNDDETTKKEKEKDSSSASSCHGSFLHRQTIGRLPQFTTASTMHVLDQAVQAWNGGSGTWTQMTLTQRMTALTNVLDELQQNVREEIVEVLMWEIGKNRPDAEAEFDRTVQFAKQVMDVIRSNDMDIASGTWQTFSKTTHALVRRAALGIILCLGPYNYPINETYATLIPALLMGNICILKIPSVGGLSHLLTFQAFAKHLPPGAINFIAGPGRSTAPPLMKSGKIDGLAFIGGSDVADGLIRAHPHPHRLKVFLQLEANNMAIYLPDLFDNSNNKTSTATALENALDQAIVGSLSYNGQRCTALKLHMVPSSHAAHFAQLLARRVEELSVGLPWQTHFHRAGSSPNYSDVTPLPNAKRIAYMQELLDDAVAKGATILNSKGGMVLGGGSSSSLESTLMVPAVVYPVTSDMRLFHEEQFGPLVPVAPYDDIETVLEFGREGIYGQQVSIFGTDASMVSPILDAFSAVFGKVNLNTQCGRSPDALPFSGRRSSAMGVMSIKDALKEFSTPTVIAYKDTSSAVNNAKLAQELEQSARFLQPIQ